MVVVNCGFAVYDILDPGIIQLEVAGIGLFMIKQKSIKTFSHRFLCFKEMLH